MKKKLRFLALLCAVGGAIPLPASADFVTGQDLNSWANAKDRVTARTATDDDFYSSAELTGYVLASFDRLELDAPVENCFRAPTAGQIVSIVTNYVRAHPEQWDRSGAFLVTKAIIGACKANGSNK